MKQIDLAIIGSGISGISFAENIPKNTNYLIFDKNKKIGGCIDTQQYDNFFFEMGAHTIYNSYAETLKYIENQNLINDISNRKKLPFLFVENNIAYSLFRKINLFSFALNFALKSKISKQNKTVEEYSKKVFGKKNYSKTFKYCFDAVLSQNSNKFPMEFLFKKYPKNKSYPRSFNLKNGLSNLFKNIDTSKIKNENILQVKKENNFWKLTTNNSEYLAKNLCLATDWENTDNFLNQINLNVANNINKPKVSKIKSLSIVIDKKYTSKIKKVSGYIGKESFFYSMVSSDVNNNEKYRAFTFHCKNINESDTKLINEIINLLKIKKSNIVYTYSKINTLPIYQLNHQQFINDLDNELSKNNNLFITGNFFDRLAIENCIKRSVKEGKRYKNKLRF